jgi:hypothetical protein
MEVDNKTRNIRWRCYLFTNTQFGEAKRGVLGHEGKTSRDENWAEYLHCKMEITQTRMIIMYNEIGESETLQYIKSRLIIRKLPK